MSTYQIADIMNDPLAEIAFGQALDAKVKELIDSGELTEKEMRKLDRDICMDIGEHNTRYLNKRRKVPKHISDALKAEQGDIVPENVKVAQKALKGRNRAKRKAAKKRKK